MLFEKKNGVENIPLWNLCDNRAGRGYPKYMNIYKIPNVQGHAIKYCYVWIITHIFYINKNQLLHVYRIIISKGLDRFNWFFFFFCIGNYQNKDYMKDIFLETSPEASEMYYSFVTYNVSNWIVHFCMNAHILKITWLILVKFLPMD